MTRADTTSSSTAPRQDAHPTIVIEPATFWQALDLRELFHSRHVLWVLLWRNVKMRYRQTALGPFWFVLVPFLRMVLFSVILGGVAGLPTDGGVPYPIFVYSALLPWQLFDDGVTRSTECFVRYQGMITRIYFPRLLLPLAEIGTALIDFTLSFGILIALVLWYDFPLTSRILALPFLLAMTMALSTVVGLLLAALYARFRDVSYFRGYFIKLWFYGTPVVYSASLLQDKIPKQLLWLYELNPMNGVIEGFRWALVGSGRAPDLRLGVTALVIGILVAVSAMVFRRTEHSIADLV